MRSELVFFVSIEAIELVMSHRTSWEGPLFADAEVAKISPGLSDFLCARHTMTKGSVCQARGSPCDRKRPTGTWRAKFSARPQ